MKNVVVIEGCNSLSLCLKGNSTDCMHVGDVYGSWKVIQSLPWLQGEAVRNLKKKNLVGNVGTTCQKILLVCDRTPITLLKTAEPETSAFFIPHILLPFQ